MTFKLIYKMFILYRSVVADFLRLGCIVFNAGLNTFSLDDGYTLRKLRISMKDEKVKGCWAEIELLVAFLRRMGKLKGNFFWLWVKINKENLTVASKKKLFLKHLKVAATKTAVENFIAFCLFRNNLFKQELRIDSLYS